MHKTATAGFWSQYTSTHTVWMDGIASSCHWTSRSSGWNTPTFNRTGLLYRSEFLPAWQQRIDAFTPGFSEGLKAGSIETLLDEEFYFTSRRQWIQPFIHLSTFNIFSCPLSLFITLLADALRPTDPLTSSIRLHAFFSTFHPELSSECLFQAQCSRFLIWRIELSWKTHWGTSLV